MSDENTSTASTTPNAVTAPAGATININAGGAASQTPAREPDGKFKSADPEEAKAQLRADLAAERLEKRRLKEEAEALKAALDAAKAEADTRVQNEVRQVTDRLTKAQSRTVDAVLRAEASAAGLEDMDLLPLIKRDGISINDDFDVVGVAEAIAAFRESKPTYFKQAGNQQAQQTQVQAPRQPVTTGSPNTPKEGNTGAPTNVKALSAAEYKAMKSNRRARLQGVR